MNLEKLAGLLGNLSMVATNPVFSGAGAAVASALRLASALVARGAEGADDLEKLCDEVDVMVKDNRQPTPVELKGLRSRSDAAHSVMQGTAPAPTGAAATRSDPGNQT